MDILTSVIYGILVLVAATLVAIGFAPGFYADMLAKARAKGRPEDGFDRVATAGAAFLGLWVATVAVGVALWFFINIALSLYFKREMRQEMKQHEASLLRVVRPACLGDRAALAAGLAAGPATAGVMEQALTCALFASDGPMARQVLDAVPADSVCRLFRHVLATKSAPVIEPVIRGNRGFTTCIESHGDPLWWFKALGQLRTLTQRDAAGRSAFVSFDEKAQRDEWMARARWEIGPAFGPPPHLHPASVSWTLSSEPAQIELLRILAAAGAPLRKDSHFEGDVLRLAMMMDSVPLFDAAVRAGVRTDWPESAWNAPVPRSWYPGDGSPAGWPTRAMPPNVWRALKQLFPHRRLQLHRIPLGGTQDSFDLPSERDHGVAAFTMSQPRQALSANDLAWRDPQGHGVADARATASRDIPR